MPRHAEQDAIDAATFDRLLEATDELDEPYQQECRFVLIAAGRLGLRAGEIGHLEEDWIDWERSRINIPRYEPCTRGKDGGACGYCRKRARSRVRHDDALTLEEALEERWNPKTPHSVRSVPFDFDDEVEEVVEAFFWHFDRYEHSRQSVNRRVNRVAEAAGLDPSELYPHALRATAATYHAYQGVSTAAIQSLFGWKKLSVAEKYIRLSGEATADALYDAHS